MSVNRRRRAWIVAAAAAIVAIAYTVAASSRPTTSGYETDRVAAILDAAVDVGQGVAPIHTYRCSGFLRTDATLLTAAHCVEGADTVIVGHGSRDICDAEGWSMYVATVLEVDLPTDTALLALEEPISVREYPPSSSGHYAIGWQQRDRATPLSCQAMTVDLLECQPDGPMMACRAGRGSTVCSGLSGAAVIYGGAPDGVISKSLGCADGEVWYGLLPERFAEVSPG